LPIEIAPALGHRSTGRAPEEHPDILSATLALLPRAGAGARRSAGFERILGFAALIFPMTQDAIDDPGICNKGNDPHAGVALTDQRGNLKDFSEQARPGAPGFPGEIGIALLCAGFGCRTGSLANGG
jgi:hypothetical protein